MNVKFAELARVPLFVPVTVMAEFPMIVDVLYAAVGVGVALPDVLMDAGEKLAVTPAGNPLTQSAAVPVNPFSAETLTV